MKDDVKVGAKGLFLGASIILIIWAVFLYLHFAPDVKYQPTPAIKIVDLNF